MATEQKTTDIFVCGKEDLIHKHKGEGSFLEKPKNTYSPWICVSVFKW